MSYRFKIHDKLYDLTEFAKIHPGGIGVFKYLKPDTNITPLIYSYHKNPENIISTILPKYEVPLENRLIEYDTDYKYDRYCELKKLVYAEIQEKKLPLFWPMQEIVYNCLMFLLYASIWVYCYSNADDLSVWWMILLGTLNIGYCALVFHETGHYTGFKIQRMNSLISALILAPIIPIEEWKFEHNYLHHAFTNTPYDDDLSFNSFFLRYSTDHKYHFHHQFQYLYSGFLFTLAALSKGPVCSIHKKRWNIITFLYLVYTFGFMNTFAMYAVTGFLFASIAQLSHIQDECIDPNDQEKTDFMYNQISSSVNYKTDNPLIRFITLGLDIQIEHHLFPNIPHSTLRQIKHIVRKYCDEHAIEYKEKESIYPLIYSFYQYLYKMGKA